MAGSMKLGEPLVSTSSIICAASSIESSQRPGVAVVDQPLSVQPGHVNAAAEPNGLLSSLLDDLFRPLDLAEILEAAGVVSERSDDVG